MALSLFGMNVNAAESWSSGSRDTAGWSLVKYTNKTSGVIGEFAPGEEGLGFAGASEGEEEGLVGGELGFLRYTLQSSASLAGYHNGTVSLGFQDTATTTKLLPMAILLEGVDSQGSRLILAGQLDVRVSDGRRTAQIDLVSTRFRTVTDYFYKKSGSVNPMDQWAMEFDDSAPSLCDENFAALLGSVHSLMIRSYHSISDWNNPGIGGEIRPVPYTFLYSLSIAAIPEPACATLALLGFAALTAGRRRQG